MSRCFNSPQSFRDHQSQMTTGNILIMVYTGSTLPIRSDSGAGSWCHPHGPHHITSIWKVHHKAGSFPQHNKNLFKEKGKNLKVIIDAILRGKKHTQRQQSWHKNPLLGNRHGSAPCSIQLNYLCVEVAC